MNKEIKEIILTLRRIEGEVDRLISLRRARNKRICQIRKEMAWWQKENKEYEILIHDNKNKWGDLQWKVKTIMLNESFKKSSAYKTAMRNKGRLTTINGGKSK